MGNGAKRRDYRHSESSYSRICAGGLRKVSYVLTKLSINYVVGSLSAWFLYRLVSVARGEQDYFSPDGIPTASEGCKSNALMRCCKDLGVASELWDPQYIRKFKAEHVREVFVEHMVSKQKKRIFLRKDAKVGYPFKETKAYGSA